jgi:hypothetical protein
LTDHAWEALRQDMMARLPRLLDKALATYTYFAGTPPPEGAKEFAAFQTSCRAALAHIHLLIKLAHWAQTARGEAGCGENSADDQITRLIEEAEAALDRFPPDEF